MPETPVETALVLEAVPPARPAGQTFAARVVGFLRAQGAIAGLLAVATFLRVFHLGDRPGQLIGDERYYVQDARVIAGLPLDDFKSLPAHALSGLDPNPEHPPLAKLIMAGFMKVFGNNGVAWRTPAVILGTLSILLLYLIVQRLGGTKRQALFAAFVLAFDNLSFVQGRIAMLEIYVTAFILLGTWLYLADCFELAGLAFAVAGLCKLSGLCGLFAVLLYDAMGYVRSSWRGSWRATWPALRPSWKTLRPPVTTLVFCVLFLLAALGMLDNYFTAFKSPLDQLAFMVYFHARLMTHGSSGWLARALSLREIDFYGWNGDASGGFHYALNPNVIWVALPALSYAGWRAWTDRSRLGGFAVASFAANFGPPYLAWLILSRLAWVYYLVPSVPAVACAIALAADAVPRAVRWCFVGTVLAAFALNFPFRYFGF